MGAQEISAASLDNRRLLNLRSRIVGFCQASF
jgi:hypothetical protein